MTYMGFEIINHAIQYLKDMFYLFIFFLIFIYLLIGKVW